MGRAPDVGDGGGNQRLVGEQSISARVNISASIIAFYTPALTYPSPLLKRRGILSVKPKDKHVLYGYWGGLWKENYVICIALEPWLNACQCMPLMFEVSLI